MLTSDKSKDSIKAETQQRMEALFKMPNWTLRQKVALTCRILFAGGHDSGLAGQITARGAKDGTFFTQRLGMGFDEVTSSDVLLVDDDLNVLEGTGMPNPANRFHAWVYRARPDVKCIIHTHPFYVSALSMLETPLIVSHMDTSILFDDCAFLENWPGVPVGNDEGKIISEALGDKRAILLSHHGQLVACGGVEEACILALTIERAAKLQILASAAGTIKEIPAHLAKEAHDWLLGRKRIEATFVYRARRVLKDDPDCLT